jgi:hypothetical protein
MRTTVGQWTVFSNRGYANNLKKKAAQEALVSDVIKWQAAIGLRAHLVGQRRASEGLWLASPGAQ